MVHLKALDNCFKEQCAPSRIRTYDPLIKSQLLYQLSYRRKDFLTPPLAKELQPSGWLAKLCGGELANTPLYSTSAKILGGLPPAELSYRRKYQNEYFNEKTGG